MTNRPSPDDLLGGRKGAKTFNFPSKCSEDKQKLIKGSKIEGEVVEREVTQQVNPDDYNEKLYWDVEETKPKWQLVITLQTTLKEDPEDDGKRRIFAKWHLLNAISGAVADAEAPGVEVGGYLVVDHNAITPPEKKHHSPTKLYEAEYTSAADRLVQKGGSAPAKEEPVVEVEEPAAPAGVDADAALAALAALTPAQRKALGLS